MFLSYSERLDAESRGKRAGETKDGLYDSTPPHYFGACPKRATEWRDAYRKGFNLARRERGYSMTPENQIKLQKLQAVHSALIVLERALDDGIFPAGVLTLKSGSRLQSGLVAAQIEDLVKGSKQ